MQNKIILITNYWRPWNTAGTFRWLHLSKYIEFDVLTSKRPLKGICDETIPNFREGQRIIHIGRCFPAFLSGLFLSVVSWFVRSDIYVYSSPPETLIIGAWISQMMGRKTILDLRDKINRPDKNSWFRPIYEFIYRRIKNKVVTMSHFDEKAKLIRHGYALERKGAALQKYTLASRFDYFNYTESIMYGVSVEYKNSKEHYTSSSVVELRHLGNEIKGKETLHPELFEFEPDSWKDISNQYMEYIKRIVCNVKNN